MKKYSVWIMAALWSLVAQMGWAQWVTQDFPLHAGWNALFLQVQPDPSDCDTLFSNELFDVESIRTFDDLYSSVQFISTTNELILKNPSWLTWFPPEVEERFLQNLFSLEAGKAYFIKRSDDASNVIWSVQGRSLLKEVPWRPQTFNLVGFNVDPTNPPTFYDFFKASPEHTDQPIFRMNEQGKWVRVDDPATESMRKGEAFWIQMDDFSRYQGPVRLRADQRSGLSFGRGAQEDYLHVYNDSLFPKTIQINAVPSAPPSAGSAQPVLAGEVPLSYWDSQSTVGWVPFTNRIEKTLEAGSNWIVRLAVRRADMQPFVPDPVDQDYTYQSVLEISDDEGYSDYRMGVQALDSEPQGVWVGSAAITHVSQPTSLVLPTNPVPTAVDFPFRVLLHLDTNGQVRLLNEVIQMWKEGSYRPDPQNPALQIVDDPGRDVWITDESLLPQFTGASLRNGEAVGRRISSAVFAFDEPAAMSMVPSMAFGKSGTELLVTLSMPFDHPLNPFMHRYHPDHNNQDEHGDPLPAGQESYTLTRIIKMTFTSQDPEGLALAGWGDSQVGGIWEERIEGLRHQPIHIKGFFRLHHVSTVGVLNDGM